MATYYYCSVASIVSPAVVMVHGFHPSVTSELPQALAVAFPEVKTEVGVQRIGGKQTVTSVTVHVALKWSIKDMAPVFQWVIDWLGQKGWEAYSTDRIEVSTFTHFRLRSL